MAKPYLTVLGGNSLGTIFKEQNSITVPLTGKSLPLSSSAGNYQVNAMGKYRIITIQGAQDGTGYTGSTQNTRIATFITAMENWVNASVQTPTYYFDSYGNQYYVMCLDWSWTQSTVDPNRIIWNLMLKEVGGI